LATISTEGDTDNFIKLLEDTLADSQSVPAVTHRSTKQRPRLLLLKGSVSASARSAVARSPVVHSMAAHSSALVNAAIAHSLASHTRHASGVLSASAAKAAAGAKWQSATGDLWASLILRNETESISFEDDDAETKADFLDRCNQTFDVPAFALPDEVVAERCQKAGGSDDECSTMVDKLWTAFNGTGNVNPWCEATYNWFEEKTIPRCLGNCKANLCKTRCTVHDKLRDLDDKETSIKFKLNQSRARNESLEFDMQMHSLKKTEMEEFNQTNCTGFRDKIAELEDTQAEVGEKIAEANETFTDLLSDETTGHDNLRKLYEADAQDADIERARSRLEETLHSLSQMRELLGSLNSRLRKIESILSGVRSRREFALKRLGEMEADYKFDDEKLAEEKETNEKRHAALEEALKKVQSQRPQYEDALAPQLEHDATSTAAPPESDALSLGVEPLDDEVPSPSNPSAKQSSLSPEPLDDGEADISVDDMSSEAAALPDDDLSSENTLDDEVEADLNSPVLAQTGR